MPPACEAFVKDFNAEGEEVECGSSDSEAELDAHGASSSGASATVGAEGCDGGVASVSDAQTQTAGGIERARRLCRSTLPTTSEDLVSHRFVSLREWRCAAAGTRASMWRARKGSGCALFGIKVVTEAKRRRDRKDF